MLDPRDVLTRSAPPPDRTVAYGPHPDQVIDVRLPARTPAPMVVVLHGGFWRAAYDRAHVGPMASALASEGYVVVVPEFRRTGQDGGAWPGTFDDVAAAMDVVPELTASYGTGPAVWLGHSAGGQLALWAAGRHRLSPDSRWRAGPPSTRGVVSLAGCCDLALCASLGLDDGATELLLGGTPEAVPDRYASADPAALAPVGVPVTLVHGTDDDRVPIEVSRCYAERARATGDPVELRELPGVEHFALIDPRSSAWPEVLAALYR